MISEGREGMEREGSWPEARPAPRPMQGAPPAVPNSPSLQHVPDPKQGRAAQCGGNFAALCVSAGICIHGVSPLFCSLGKSSGCSWEEGIQFPSPYDRAGLSSPPPLPPPYFQREAGEPVADEGKSKVVLHGKPSAYHPAPQRSTLGAIAAHAGVCIIY